MLWFNFLPMTPTYSFYSPLSLWDSWNYSARTDKWSKGFLTNTPKKELTTRMPGYEKAAKMVGAKIIIEDDAFDIRGNPVNYCSAILIDDATKRGAFWRALDEVKETKTSIIVSASPKLVLPKPCNCSMTSLMRSGCKCNGV